MMKYQSKKLTQSPITISLHLVKLPSILNSDSASRNSSAKTKIQNRLSYADWSNFTNTTRRSNLVMSTSLLEKNPIMRVTSLTTNSSFLGAISKSLNLWRKSMKLTVLLSSILPILNLYTLIEGAHGRPSLRMLKIPNNLLTRDNKKMTHYLDVDIL